MVNKREDRRESNKSRTEIKSSESNNSTEQFVGTLVCYDCMAVLDKL